MPCQAGEGRNVREPSCPVGVRTWNTAAAFFSEEVRTTISSPMDRRGSRQANAKTDRRVMAHPPCPGAPAGSPAASPSRQVSATDSDARRLPHRRQVATKERNREKKIVLIYEMFNDFMFVIHFEPRPVKIDFAIYLPRKTAMDRIRKNASTRHIRSFMAGSTLLLERKNWKQSESIS